MIEKPKVDMRGYLLEFKLKQIVVDLKAEQIDDLRFLIEQEVKVATTKLIHNVRESWIKDNNKEDEDTPT